MELSSAPKRDVLKSNLNTSYVQPMNDKNPKKYYRVSNDVSRKAKSTPRKCKTIGHVLNDGGMKKSSSLHNIEKVGELNDDDSSMITNGAVISGICPSLDNQQIYTNNDLLLRLDREKKSYETRISELILNVETRKKEKEMLSMENKRLTETVQSLQIDVGKLHDLISGLQSRVRESGFELEEVASGEPMTAYGDGGMGRSYASLTMATIGDSESVCSDESQEPVGAECDFLDTLSVSTLQDRIQKMEEDNYCTNEELQATMQELLDLQSNLDSLNEDNRHLTHERAILFQSLCEQTSNLQQSRLLSKYLKILLLSNNSSDYPNLDEKLRELYAISEGENRFLLEQNEECRQAILCEQSDCRDLQLKVDSLTEQLIGERTKFSQLEEKYRDELWQREQVETVLKNHSELFGETVGWTDCSSGVLALIQQSKGQINDETRLRLELVEKGSVIESLNSRIRQLEEIMCQGMRHKKEHEGNIDQLQSLLNDSASEVAILMETLNTLTKKYADDAINWRSFEKDLLLAICAANSLKEDRDRDLVDLEQRLEVSEQQRRLLQEKVDSQKTCMSNQVKEQAIAKREQSLISTTNSVRTLIQSIEYTMNPTASAIKQSGHSIATSNNASTIQRSSNGTSAVKHKITRANTEKIETSPCKHLPEIPAKKPSITKKELPQISLLPSAESSQVLFEPLTTVVCQTQNILQSVSRRNSVVTNSVTEHHSNFESPSTNKPPSPQTTPPPDPLALLVKRTNKGSKRNALLFWCQTRTSGYQKIDITNFSSSWNDGLALCALLHSIDQSLVDYGALADATSSTPDKHQKRNNFLAAFTAAEKLGIRSLLDIETMVNVERPTWNSVMNYVVEIYTHAESLQPGDVIL